QVVSSFDHFVTQWMSFVTLSRGSCWNSSHVQVTGSAPPVIENVHSSSGVCGVGPAESTGKSSVRYWPGGTRSGGPSWRRPRNPREMIPTAGFSQFSGRVGDTFELVDDPRAASRARRLLARHLDERGRESVLAWDPAQVPRDVALDPEHAEHGDETDDGGQRPERERRRRQDEAADRGPDESGEPPRKAVHREVP